LAARARSIKGALFTVEWCMSCSLIPRSAEYYKTTKLTLELHKTRKLIIMKNKSIREILYEAIICSLGPQLSIYTIIGVTVFQVRLNTIGGAFRGSGCIYVLFNGKVGKNALHASPPKHGSMRVSGPHVKDGFGAESLQFSHPPPSFPPHPANRNKPKNCRRRHYQNHIPIDLTAAASWPLFFLFLP